MRALDVIITLGRTVDFAISAWIPPWLHKLDDRTESAIAIICISLFFLLLFRKYFTASTSDAKRRLGILVWGAEIGLTPMFIGVVIAEIRNHGDLQGAVPSWYFWTCLILFIFFPLSMAYVILVQRAMDVRILLRQGTQYALARGTLLAIRVILGTLLGVMLYQLVSHPQPSHTAQVWAVRPGSPVPGDAVRRHAAPFGLDRSQILSRGIFHRAGAERALRAGWSIHRNPAIA